MNGAGGSSGGVGQFFIGLIMMCGGGYMLLNAIRVSSSFGLGTRLYGVPAFGSQLGITGGMILVPFILVHRRLAWTGNENGWRVIV